MGGYVGLTIFFVLSGFLITSHLLEEHEKTGQVDVRAFYRKRVLRIAPALAIMLAAVFVSDRMITVVRHGWPFSELLVTSGSALIGLYDLFVYRPWLAGWGVAPLWSLSVEIQFYLVWPLILATALARKPRWIGVIALAFAVESAGLCVWADVVKGNGYFAYYSTPTNLFGLMLGSFVAWKLHRGWRPRWTRQMGLVGLGVIVWIDLSQKVLPSSSFVWANPLAAICAAAMILAALDARSPTGMLFGLRPFRYLGRISYSVYLWHYLVICIVAVELPNANPAVKLIVFLSGTACVSVASYNRIELPFLRIVKWRPPARRRARTMDPTLAEGPSVSDRRTTERELVTASVAPD
jgi:peptidoglycan/LPS O-acetylase OafA/YrhL